MVFLPYFSFKSMISLVTTPSKSHLAHIKRRYDTFIIKQLLLCVDRVFYTQITIPDYSAQTESILILLNIRNG